MKIELFTDLTVELPGDEIVKVQVRDLTPKESKEFQAKVKDIVSSSNKSKKINRKIKNIERKLEIVKDDKKVLKLLEEQDKLHDEIEELEDDFINGGVDNIEKMYADKFELVISGDGKDRLREVAELRGFEKLLSQIAKAKEEQDSEGN